MASNSDGIPYEKFADGKTVDISDEIPFAIPPTWQWVKLKNIFNVSSARRVHQADWKDSGIPFYRAREIAVLAEKNYIDNELFISESQFEYFKQQSGVPNVGDLMVTAVGTIGKTYIVKKSDRFYYKDASVVCFENYASLNSFFFKFLMASPFMVDQVQQLSAGTTVDTITIIKANEYFLPLPPLAEQQRIVAKIEKLLPHIERYGKAEAELDELQRRFPNELKKSILQSAIQGNLVPQDPADEPAEVLLERIRTEKACLIKSGKIKPAKNETTIFRASDRLHYERCDTETRCIEDELPFQIPDSWQWVRLDTICIYIQRGKSPKYSLIKKYPVVAQKCNQWSGFSLDKAQFIEPNSLSAYSEERLLQDGDLLWNSTGLGTLGRMAIYAHAKNPYGIAVADSHVTVIRAMKNFIISNYLYDYFTAPIVQSVIEEKSDGSTKQKELATTTVKNYLVPLPPLAEQMRIVTKIEELLKNIAQIKP